MLPYINFFYKICSLKLWRWSSITVFVVSWGQPARRHLLINRCWRYLVGSSSCTSVWTGVGPHAIDSPIQSVLVLDGRWSRLRGLRLRVVTVFYCRSTVDICLPFNITRLMQVIRYVRYASLYSTPSPSLLAGFCDAVR